MGQTPPPAKRTAAPPPPAAPEAKPTPPAAPEPPAEQPAPTPVDPPAAPAPAPVVQEAPSAPEQPEPAQPPEPPALDLTAKADAADEAERRKAHEAAEAKRKAEWDAKQAEKKVAEQAALDKLAAMSDADAISEAAKRVSDTVEKITRRSMKEQVSDHLQALCRRDPDFARKTMHPRKSMIRCFRYISRKAYEYVKDELEADGIRPGPGSEGYGCDVPDDLCYQWAEDYFNDPDAEEDKPKEETFTPKPYIPSTKAPSAAKKKQAADKKPPKPKGGADAGQITLGGFSTEAKAV